MFVQNLVGIYIIITEGFYNTLVIFMKNPDLSESSIFLFGDKLYQFTLDASLMLSQNSQYFWRLAPPI